MNTVFSPTPASVGLGSDRALEAAPPARLRSRLDGARGLSTLLLAAGVAALVVLADRMIRTWTDGHLFMGWVALWVVILAGTALFADPARRLARRALRSAHSWALALAEARAEMRFWNASRADHRVMAELAQASQRDLDAEADAATPTPGWGRFPEQRSMASESQIHLRHS